MSATDRERALSWLTENLAPAASQLAQLESFAELLLAEAARQNLVSRQTLPNLWRRHILDSAQLLLHVPRETKTWIDLGTAAGFPGLICAILRPDIRFVLVEQRKLRCEWLEAAGEAALGLTNVQVACTKLQRLEAEPYDVISARAFAPLDRLLRLAQPFSTKRTRWLLPKGASAAQELAELVGWNHAFHVEQSATDAAAGIIVGRLMGEAGKAVHR